jgi:tetraacyldisaccharide 4'-kinase
VVPRGVAVVGVGGATLGGSYKTPLVLALAGALSERGERLAVVAHGYGSRKTSEPRCVDPRDSAKSVGDDAFWLFRELSPLGVPVVVGGDRSAALTLGASLAPRLMVDGLLQAEPRRLTLSVLAVDAGRPWGAGRCPPAGDLRAPRASLLAAADVVARVVSEHSASAPPPGPEPPLDAGSSAVVDVASALLGATSSEGELVSLASLAARRVGVVLAIARPDRVLASLAAHGIAPVETRLFRDHAAPRLRRARHGESTRPDFWLTTSKCATKMGSVYEGRPVLTLAHRLTLPAALLDAVLASTVQRAT